MVDDDVFRIMLLGLFIAFLPFAILHRLRSLTDEKLDRWQEGAVILFGLRLGAVPWFLGSLAWMINPQSMVWASVPIPVSIRAGGFVLLALWAVLLVWTFRHLGKNLTDTVVTRQDHTLITTGPYRYVRHPFYLAFFLAVAGGSIVTANWFLLLAGLVPSIFLVARTRIEEEKLIEKFGNDYRTYISHTGQYFPNAAKRN